MVKCPAHDAPTLGYLAASDDAEQRLKRRECQYRCLLCNLWIWGQHYTDRDAMGMNCWQYNRVIRAQEKLIHASESGGARE